MTGQDRALSIIANEIRHDWTKVNYAAEPYLEAMEVLNSIKDMYYFDTAVSVVLYFLSNSETWHGEVAKRIKKELHRMADM